MAELTPEYIAALAPTTQLERMTELREKSGLNIADFYTSVEGCMRYLHESFEDAMYATYCQCTHPRKDPVLSERYLFAERVEDMFLREERDQAREEGGFLADQRDALAEELDAERARTQQALRALAMAT